MRKYESFVHLHAHSDLGSLLDGIASPEALARRAAELRQPALALTDHGSLGSAIKHYQACAKYGIKPILGYEAYAVRSGSIQFAKNNQDRTNHHLTILAADNTGWQNLLRLATIASTEGFYQKPRLDRRLLMAHHEGLIVLSGCMGSEVSRRILAGDFDGAVQAADWFRAVFEDRFYLEIHEHGMADEVPLTAGLLALSRKLGIPLVAANDVHYLLKADEPYHDIAMKTQTGGKLGGFETKEFYLKSFGEMCATGLPEDALRRTLEVAERCNVVLSLGQQEFPRPAGVPDGADEHEWLTKLAQDGADRVYGLYWDRDEAFVARLRDELGVIRDTGFIRYFLIVADMVNWARQQGILSSARGSAAGSLVAYCVGITPVDPIRFNLVFERFLNPGRAPDVDLDFADDRRHEVIDYLVHTYGPGHVAQIITYGIMAGRSSIRDVARALDYPYDVGDRLAKLVPNGVKLAKAVEDVPELVQERGHPVIAIALHLEGTARNAGTHAAGVVIGARPLVEVVPLTRARDGSGVPLTQWEMHDLETVGLAKFDILGLANLSILAHTVHLIRQHRGVDVLPNLVPGDDRKTFMTLGAAETTGVFQLESPGMRRYLRQLQPDSVEDLMAMVALYRPGPLHIIPEFIARKRGEQPVEYPHPALEPILKRTYGLMVYQEAIMEIAKTICGMDLAEADKFLYAVRKKVAARLAEYEPRFRAGAAQHGMPADVIDKLWADIQPFSQYGFNRAHAACYGWLAYQTAYLKAHHAPEYMAALLTSEAGDPAKVARAIAEARLLDVLVLGPSINRSDISFTVEDAIAVRFGLGGIKHVGQVALKAILDERRTNGPYRSFDDFRARLQKRRVNSRAAGSLVGAGAFDEWGLRQEMGLKERLDTEQALMGVAVSDSPLAPYAEVLATRCDTLSDALESHSKDDRVLVGGLIVVVRPLVTKKTGERMASVTLEDRAGAMTVTVFPRLYQYAAPALQEGVVVLVGGRVDFWQGDPQVIAETVAPVGGRGVKE